MKEPLGRTTSAADVMPIALVLAALYFARAILVPVALAVLLTFLLAPVVGWLQRYIRTRSLAVALVTVTVVAVAAAGTFAVGQQFVGLASRLPEYRETIGRKVRSIRESTRGVVSDTARTLRSIGTELAEGPSAVLPAPTSNPGAPIVVSMDGALAVPVAAGREDGDPITTMLGMARPFASPLATGLVVVLLLSMMLHAREAIRDKVIRLAGLRQISLTTHALEETASRVGRYLRAQCLINFIYGAVVYLGLLALGLPNALVCGIIAGVLRFVPIVGVWLGAVIPAVLAIAVFDGWAHLALVASLVIALELAANFILEPWLYGSSTGISSIGVVFALIFWTWMWGGVGLVLAMPMTVCVMVFARQFPRLAVVPILFGDEEALSESARFYQRVLGNNEDDAAAILRTAPPAPRPAADSPHDATVARLDAVVVPALGTVRQELLKGSITDDQAGRVARGARDVAIDWISELPGEPMREPRAGASGPGAICLPVHDESDECAGAILAACLEARGVTLNVLSVDLLLGEMLRAAHSSGAPVVVLSAIAPSSRVHTRRVCKAVRRALPEARIVVCAWNAPHDGATAGEVASGADAEASTMKGAMEAVARMAVAPAARP